MELLKEYWQGITDIPEFMWIIMFKSGIASAIFWLSVVTSGFLFMYERDSNKGYQDKWDSVLGQDSKQNKRYGTGTSDRGGRIDNDHYHQKYGLHARQ